MSIPSVEEVNARRAVRFAQAITDSMGSAQFHTFRGLVEDYARDHDVAMPDVAAALAVMSSTDKEFFLSPDPPKAPPRDRPPRAGKSVRATSKGFAPYKIAVGKRHKIGPSSIVGALANEGGLRRSDFGKITIGVEHSIVELPHDLPDAVLDALTNTRISGKRIDIRPDSGPPQRKPRHKNR
jgi:ATP-dependent RNA helicase DeaD